MKVSPKLERLITALAKLEPDDYATVSAHTRMRRRDRAEKGGLRLPNKECRRFRAFFAREGIDMKPLPGGWSWATFPAGTKVWHCPLVQLPSGETFVVMIGDTRTVLRVRWRRTT